MKQTIKMYPKDAKTITAIIPYGGDNILLEGDQNTIFHVDYAFEQYDDTFTVANSVGRGDCDAGSGNWNYFTPIYVGIETAGTKLEISSSPRNTFDGTLLCDTDIIGFTNTNTANAIATITYVPYDIHASKYSFIGSVSYGDWLLVSGIMLFLVSFMTWGYLWSPFKHKKQQHGSYPAYNS